MSDRNLPANGAHLDSLAPSPVRKGSIHTHRHTHIKNLTLSVEAHLLKHTLSNHTLSLHGALATQAVTHTLVDFGNALKTNLFFLEVTRRKILKSNI